MGHYSDMQIEMREEGENRTLASVLGITLDELEQLDARVEGNHSKDDMLYDYTVYFGGDAPNSILKKIAGIDMTSRTVTISPNSFDSPDPDQD